MTRTLHIQIGTTVDRSDLEEEMAAIDADGPDAIAPGRSTLVVESLETFGRVFRPTNLELLDAIAANDPQSIRELARLVGRHPPDVLDNINELVDYGLVELEEHGSAKRPVVWYDELDVDIPLGGSTADVASA